MTQLRIKSFKKIRHLISSKKRHFTVELMLFLSQITIHKYYTLGEFSFCPSSLFFLHFGLQSPFKNILKKYLFFKNIIFDIKIIKNLNQKIKILKDTSIIFVRV
jgi:hypothetical protein